MAVSKSIRDKIHACWLGKSIGGTLGAPVEGHKEFMDLKFYTVLGKDGALPNDDLDLQLVNLHAAEQHGIYTNAEAIAAEWTEHVRFPWDEYGYAGTAMRYGLKPPYSGYFDNPFTDCMGSPIRSEIWAVVACGDPALASYFAWQDAVVDHAGGEGVYGEMFYAALETLALAGKFKDNASLVKRALRFIPKVSRVYKAVNDTVKWYEKGVKYPEIRDLILEKHGRANFTDAPQNLAFSIVGLLYGENFEDGLLKTVNLGYDTDCTVATIGSIYGLLYGTSFIPEKWSGPIGEKVVVSDAILGCDAPADNDELTDRCVRLIETFKICDKSFCRIPSEDALDVERQTTVLPGKNPVKNLSVTVRYEGGAAVVPGEKKTVYFDLLNNSQGKFTLKIDLESNLMNYTDISDREIVLNPGESKRITCAADAPDTLPKVIQSALILKRFHAGEYWSTYKVPFTMIRANKWVISGKKHYFEGAKVSFARKSPKNAYTAECEIFVPSDRIIKFITASVSPVSMTLDGNKVIDDGEHRDFMPAYHRCPETQSFTCNITAGKHKISVTVTEDGFVPSFTFGMVAPREVSEPGNHNAYVDCEIV